MNIKYDTVLDFGSTFPPVQPSGPFFVLIIGTALMSFSVIGIGWTLKVYIWQGLSLSPHARHGEQLLRNGALTSTHHD